ncbi:endopeptidase La [bacterium]
MIIANNDKEFVIPESMPYVPVRDVVIFPHMMMPLAVGREKSIKSIEQAMADNRLVFISTQKKLQIEDPKRDNVYQVGTIAEILQLLKIPDGTLKVLVEGLQRGRILDFYEKNGHIEVEAAQIIKRIPITQQVEAAMRNVVHLFEQYTKLNKRLPFDVNLNLLNIEDPDRLTDVVASHMLIKVKDKQVILENVDPIKRLELVAKILMTENEILSLERKIQGRIRGQIEKSQKEYYLNEQMKAIQKELKKADENANEMVDLEKEIKRARMPKEAEEIAVKEIRRLAKMMPYSPEATVIRTYIDWLINVPWDKKTEDKLNIKSAQKILDEDHYGLDKAKDRILEYLAVCKLSKKLRGPILCFVGPPGVGKTSLGRSIARSMGRRFIRISLGGMRDEAEIRGHRRTYIGALPGRIIQSLKKAQFKNPVFVLDEIDKLGQDFRGDPASALLEVLDSEQNHSFSDHYLEVGFDLSDVLFITTANTTYNIPPALLDRMELIRFPGYTINEKVHIAERYLIPKQLKENGVTDKQLEFNVHSLNKIIDNYTEEAGVRNLEREIANVCRKAAKEIVTAKQKSKKAIKIGESNVDNYLGIPKYHRDTHAVNEVGVATGLAWTESGGDVLNIEVSIMPIKSGLCLTLTGKLGDVMKESAQAALSYVRSNSKKLGIKQSMFDNKEIHIHVPEGAIPKDGPSAGITIVTALVSALTGKPVRKNVAMTGEITLRGRILPIGGVKEKIVAAHRTGMKKVFIPWDNEKDLEEVPKEILHAISLMRVKNIKDVISKAITAK